MEAYFYCDSYKIPDLAYHDYVCMAEGLLSLGIACFGDRNMYRPGEDEDFLIRQDRDHGIEKADLIFFHFLLYRQGNKVADKKIAAILDKVKPECKGIFIDSEDGVRTPGFEKGAQSCDIILKSHYNRKYKYPKNFIPWQFGLTNRIIEAVHPLPFSQRKQAFLVNFRVKHQLRDYLNNCIRALVEKNLLWDNSINNPATENLQGYDLLMWKQTYGRHFPSYYNKLSKTAACACYGGVFALAWGNYNKYTAKVARQINEIIPLFAWDRVRQWEAWRLWEAWVAGCCVVHVDFDKYGCQLPVMPQNKVHYLGIDLNNLEDFENSVRNNDLLEQIAENGRNFVLQHYTPRAIATRLLETLNLKLG
jgi:hypothetical protein